MKDGTVGWNPGKLNPKIVKPAGPIDPQVPVVYFASPDAKPIATYVNFAMHLDTTGGTAISADYPFTLARLLAERRAGDGHGLLHRDGWRHQPRGREHQVAAARARRGAADRHDARAEVLKTYAKVGAGGDVRSPVASEIVPLALPDISKEDVEQAQKSR